MKKTQVEILTFSSRQTSEGMTDTDWVRVEVLSGILLPASGDLAYKVHGVVISASARFYCRVRSGYLKSGNRVIANGRTYLITYVADYIKLLDVWLEEVP